MKRCLVTLILAILLVPVSALAAGPSSSAVVHVSWTVLPFQSLTIDGSVAGTNTSITNRYDVRKPDASDFAAGFIEDDGVLVLNAASNIPWAVKVHSIESDMGTSYNGSYIKPLSDFMVRVNGGSFFSISTSDQVLASGTRGAYLLSVDYKVKVNEGTYKDGDYGLTLVYTITGK
ncbi:MAG TPA: hypothetical protein ENH11_07715 [Candidatus Acetothermia bacterium]|nr:hypothetical protein [Candidatus Acetothermia bacterium]